MIKTPYEDLLRDVLENGSHKDDRTGTGTTSVFGRQIRYDLSEGFPLITTKKVHMKSVIYELLFFLGGHTNNGWLESNGVTIWQEWADQNGNLGPIYSHQWRRWGGAHESRRQPRRSRTSRGSYVKGRSRVEDGLFSTWRGVVARCYTSSKEQYPYYGGRGVYLDDSWANFDNFYRDAQLLDGWENKLSNWTGYQLDKDTVGDGFCYSMKNCRWVSVSDNSRARFPVVYILRHESGEIAATSSPIEFYSARGIQQGNFCSMLRGERRAAGGWSLLEAIDPSSGIDQIAGAVDLLRTNPDSRRNIVSAWNVADLRHMALPPCHFAHQLYVVDGKLSLQVYQRSADLFLGVPFNIASYALLTHMYAQQADLEVGELIWSGGDCHIYSNHIEQVKEQLTREPYPYPKLELNKRDSIFDYEYSDVKIVGYQSHPAIKAEVAV